MAAIWSGSLMLAIVALPGQDPPAPLFVAPPAPAQPIPYSHKRHLALGFECRQCHVNPEEGTLMTYPPTAICMFDAAVLLVFALVYMVIAYQLVGAVTHRFPGDERFARAAALIVVSVMTVVAAVLVGDSWSIGAEVLRVGNGHLSYRTERLPWRQYRPAIVLTALGVFWLVAVVRIKTDSVQAAERPAMIGTDDELHSSR